MIEDEAEAGRATNSVAAANAKIAARYDQVPYVSNPFPQSHPARLGAVAHLYGLSAPPVESVRVLEIGCAAGGNIIPLAACYPRARFLGLELSSVQTKLGNERIARQGLNNISIAEGDVVAFQPKPGEFDYILCHGVYSWASPPARAAILRVIADGLAPTGVAFLSYNVLPGWRHKQVLRDALMSRVRGVADASAQIAYTRAFLAAMKDWTAPDTAYHRDLRETAAHAMTIADDYLAHEFLENFNEPQTFMQFVEECDGANLAFLGEGEMWMQFVENFDPPTQQLLRTLSGREVLPFEQSVDIVTGRTFRQTLLVPAARGAEINRTVVPERLAGLHFLGSLRLAPTPADGFAATFLGGNNKTISTRTGAAARVFESIIACSPASLSYADAVAIGETPEDRGSIIDALFKAVVSGLIDTRRSPVLAAAAVSERPLAPAWCRNDAAAGDRSTASLRHNPVGLDIVAQALLPLLDGAHDWQDLCVALLDKVKAGEMKFLRDNNEVREPREVKVCADEHVAQTLNRLLANALLAA